METFKLNRWTGYVKKQKPCTNVNCSNLVWKGKYCSKCRQRKSRHGDVNIKLSRRKLEYDENIIQKNSPESHYFIGWIASDGYIDQKNNRVKLEICDKDVLDNFKRILNYSGEIKKSIKRKAHHKQAYRLNITNVKMTNDFVDIGIKQAKSKTIEMPKINKEHYYHFLRGLIEGDGSVICSKHYNKRKNKCRNRFFIFFNSASKKLVDSITELTEIKPTSTIILKNEGYDDAYRLVWTEEKALALCELIYKDSENLRLDRKYQKYLEYKAYREKRPSLKRLKGQKFPNWKLVSTL